MVTTQNTPIGGNQTRPEDGPASSQQLDRQQQQQRQPGDSKQLSEEEKDLKLRREISKRQR